MTPLFETQFTVKPSFDKEAFIEEVLKWLKGMGRKGAGVMRDEAQRDISGAEAFICGADGDELYLREATNVRGDEIIGQQYTVPDGARAWQTEAVLLRPAEGGPGVFRMRARCVAREGLPELERPKKPYLIKRLIQGGWAEKDGAFDVGEALIDLPDTAEGRDMAERILTGKGSERLPVVYCSAPFSGQGLSRRNLNNLAFMLGGIAHVVVEPTSDFARQLRITTQGQNPYNGAIGLVVPRRGVMMRIRPPQGGEKESDLVARVIDEAAMIRSHMAFDEGCSWTQLIEARARNRRDDMRGRASSQALEDELAEQEKLYTEELEAKDEIIREREQEIKELQDAAARAVRRTDAVFQDDFLVGLEPEIYEGENFDRVRFVLEEILAGRQVMVDPRSRACLERLLDQTDYTGRAKALWREIRNATKDARGFDRNVSRVLESCGYVAKSDNKHLRMQAGDGFNGLEPITVMHSPSDARGKMNHAAQLAGVLGIKDLKTR